MTRIFRGMGTSTGTVMGVAGDTGKLGIDKRDRALAGNVVPIRVFSTNLPLGLDGALAIPNFLVPPGTPITVPVQVPIPRKIRIIRLVPSRA